MASVADFDAAMKSVYASVFTKKALEDAFNFIYLDGVDPDALPDEGTTPWDPDAFARFVERRAPYAEGCYDG